VTGGHRLWLVSGWPAATSLLVGLALVVPLVDGTAAVLARGVVAGDLWRAPLTAAAMVLVSLVALEAAAGVATDRATGVHGWLLRTPRGWWVLIRRRLVTAGATAACALAGAAAVGAVAVGVGLGPPSSGAWTAPAVAVTVLHVVLVATALSTLAGTPRAGLVAVAAITTASAVVELLRLRVLGSGDGSGLVTAPETAVLALQGAHRVLALVAAPSSLVSTASAQGAVALGLAGLLPLLVGVALLWGSWYVALVRRGGAR
jgi:hypothetical protein